MHGVAKCRIARASMRLGPNTSSPWTCWIPGCGCQDPERHHTCTPSISVKQSWTQTLLHFIAVRLFRDQIKAKPCAVEEIFLEQVPRLMTCFPIAIVVDWSESISS